MSAGRETSKVIGLVLCGGAGRRMGGKDKGLMSVDGRTNIERSLEHLKPLCERRFVSANRNLKRYALLDDIEVIPDLRPGYQGPLAGLEALASLVTPDDYNDRLILLPCDLPRLHPDVPLRLLAELDQHADKELIYASTGDQAHYLCAALRISALKTVSPRLDGADRSMRGWYASLNSAPLLFEPAMKDAFLNVNRAGDLDPER